MKSLCTVNMLIKIKKNKNTKQKGWSMAPAVEHLHETLYIYIYTHMYVCTHTHTHICYNLYISAVSFLGNWRNKKDLFYNWVPGWLPGASL
jgi:hypothetical protein